MQNKKQVIVDRMRADGRLPKLWAIAKGYKYTTVHAFLSERMRPTTKLSIAITADMKADGYITDEDKF